MADASVFRFLVWKNVCSLYFELDMAVQFACYRMYLKCGSNPLSNHHYWSLMLEKKIQDYVVNVDSLGVERRKIYCC